MKVTQPRRQKAFTLVELLVVIAIIAVLAAIASYVGVKVWTTAKEKAIAWEINELSTAIDRYRTQNKDSYPVDFSNRNTFALHMRKAFPNIAGNEINTFIQYLNNNNIDLDPSEALVFFLGGGLTDNTTNPINRRWNTRFPYPGNAVGGKPKIYYDFKEEQLADLDGDGFLSYRSKHGKQAPFVYFDSRTYAQAAAVFPKPRQSNETAMQGISGGARPYLSSVRDPNAPSNPTPWENANTFQIVSAGLDAHYGATPANNSRKIYPSGARYNEEDYDNLANFSEGKTFEDRLP